MKATQIGRQGPKMPLQEPEVKQPCIVCQKPVSAWYGRWGTSGTCSKKCEEIQESKNRYVAG